MRLRRQKRGGSGGGTIKIVATTDTNEPPNLVVLIFSNCVGLSVWLVNVLEFWGLEMLKKQVLLLVPREGKRNKMARRGFNSPLPPTTIYFTLQKQWRRHVGRSGRENTN